MSSDNIKVRVTTNAAERLIIDDILITDYSGATTYSVTYDGNSNTGGSVPTDGNAYNSGDSVTVLGNTGTLVRTGYSFNGWNTASDGSGTSYVGGNTFNITANTTLYAQWLPLEVDWCNLQFPASGTITYGNAFTAYAQVYEPSVTNAAGQGAGISAWIGYNTSDLDPSDASWTWIVATYNTDLGNNDEYAAEIGTSIPTSGTYYYASRFQFSGGPYTYGGYNAGGGGFWDGSANVNGVLTVNPDQVDFCNVDYPKTATINTGDAFTVYAQAYEPGVTNSAGQGANIEAWIGYNTTGVDYDPTNPTGWTWIVATYDSDFGNNDQYAAEIGSSLPVGTYYYASRFRLNGSDYSYGGIQADNNGNFWTSGTYNNGTLVVQNAPCSELFISEYVEGSSNNKYIEIYNPTNAAINLANYRVAKYTNGSSTVSGTPPTLSGTVGAYSTYVIGYNNSGVYTSCDFTSTYYDFNGNDVIALQTSSGVNIDVIGTVGNSANFAIDTTLRRKSTIQNPTTTYAASEWDTYATDTVSDLGSHTSDCQGPTPELQLVDNTATNQNCGYTIDFGTQALATTTDITFDIENVGSADLDISSFGITGDYSIVSPATPFTVAASSSQTVTVRFTPTANGTRTGTITINNNDPNEGTCTVDLTGVGFTPAPEINVEGNLGTFPDITNGDITPSGTDNTLFAAQFIGSSQSKSFRINNEGTANLTISSITIGGTNPGDFTITASPATTITPSTFELLEITFSPLASGVRTAVVSIVNNDSDENPFTFMVQGTGNCTSTSTTISPSSGPIGTVVTVTGTDFGGSTTATVSGISVTPTVLTATQLEVIVPSGTVTGNIVIVNDLGCTSTNAFTIVDSQIASCEGTGSSPSDIFISEVSDATVGGVSYIELYNGTGATVNLGNYSLEIIGNGSSSGNTLALNSVSLPNNSTYVVAIGVASSPDYTDPGANTCSMTGGNGELADQTSTMGGINKKDNEHDMIRLYHTASVIDEWGVYQDNDWMDSTIITGDRGFNFRRLNTASPLPNPTFNINDWNVIDWVGSGLSSCSTNDYSDIGSFDFSVGIPPSITVEPNAPSSSCDLSATISVTASEGFVGGNSLAYQWYYSAPGDAGWTAVSNGALYSGATSATLNILNTLTLNNYQYYCQVREDDATCYQASNAVRLTVDVVTWDGSSWSPTAPDNTKVAIIDGDYDLVTSPNGETSFSACNLLINNGNELSIGNGEYVSVENNIIVDGEVYVETQGSLVQVQDSGTFTLNNPSAKNTLSKSTAPLQFWYDYTYWSSPLEDAQIETALAFSRASRRYYFDASLFNDTLVEIGNTGTFNPGQDDIDDEGDDWVVQSTGKMDPGTGYAATHDNIGFVSGNQYQYIFEGTQANGGAFNTGDIYTNIFIDPSVSYNNWNLIGNPYPCAINAIEFFNDNSTLLEGTLYLWSSDTNVDPNNSGNQGLNFSQNDYAQLNGGGGIASTNGSPIPNGYVASGQGFFVIGKKTGASSGAAYYTSPVFNNSMRVTGNNNQFFRSSSANLNNRLWVNLISDNGVFNQILVGYFSGATDSYDGMFYDAPRNLSTGQYALLYSIIDGNDTKFSIQGKSETSLNLDEVIPLGFSTTINVPTTYTLSIAQLEGDFLTTNTIYLKDNLLNLYHNLSASDYSFTSEAGEFNARFEIVFQDNSLSVDTPLLPSDGLTIVDMPDGSVKFKVGSAYTISRVEIIDLLGRSLYDLNGSHSEETYFLPQLSQSAYIAKVTLSNGQLVVKKAVKR
ncbi:MAG: choice-of-anchor D domain-containing protein [Flavobacteriaceae bacterium]